MKNKVLVLGIGYVLFTMFILLPTLRWFGIPTFENIFSLIFGEPTFFSKMIVVIFSVVLIVTGLVVLFRANRKEKESE